MHKQGCQSKETGRDHPPQRAPLDGNPTQQHHQGGEQESGYVETILLAVVDMLRPETRQQGCQQCHGKPLTGQEQTHQRNQDAGGAQDGNQGPTAALIASEAAVADRVQQMAQGNDAWQSIDLRAGRVGTWMQQSVSFGEGPEFVAAEGPIAQVVETQGRRQQTDSGTESNNADPPSPHPCVLQRRQIVTMGRDESRQIAATRIGLKRLA